jgi:lipopolysaccharide/colanic/teichoic acid biosynthesis glycosyltransferase/CheY-like chemotaxis protein
MQLRKVLIVDDDSHFLNRLEIELEELGVEIQMAMSGEEALEKIAEFSPDLVVSDMEMPGMSGAELKRRARETKGGKEVPFLFVTGVLRETPEFQGSRVVMGKFSGWEAVVGRVDELLGDAEQGEGSSDAAPVEAGVTNSPIVNMFRSIGRRIHWKLKALLYPAIKRTFDVLASFFGMICLSPVFAAIAAAIVVEDGFPVLYSQDRIGKGGRKFRFYKFRSMYKDSDARRAELLGDSDDGNDVRFKMKEDPRITRTGKIIRRGSLDELPQLWNVLKGDMAVVGPRPPIPDEVAAYGVDEWRRLEIVPGITCSWQVQGRADIPFPEQVGLDIEYIQNRSLPRDLTLIVRTIPAVLTGKGAY